MTSKSVSSQTPGSAPQEPAPVRSGWTAADSWWIGGVVLLALVVRLVYFLNVSHELWFTVPIVDSDNYHRWAQAILRGDWLGKGPLVHSPLYAFFLAGLYALLGVQPVAAAAVQLGLGALSCGALFLLGRKLCSRWVGVLSGGAQALYGVALFHEGTLLTVLLIHLLHLGVLLSLYWAADRESPWAWAVPGALLGLSVLTRPNVLLWVAALAAWTLVRYPGRPRRWLSAAGALLLAVAVCMTPVLARNVKVLGEWIPTVSHGGINFYLGNSAQSSVYFTPLGNLGLGAADFIETSKQEAERLTGAPMTYSASSRFWLDRAWREIAANRGHWESLMLDKLFFFFNYYEYTTSLNFNAVQDITPILKWPWLNFRVVAPLALLGLFLLRRRWRDLFPLYALVAATWITNAVFFTTSEYRYAAMPAFFLFAGAAVENLVLRIRDRRWASLGLPGVFLLLVALLVNVDFFGREGRDYNLATGHVGFATILLHQKMPARAADEYEFAKSLTKNRPENQSWLAYQQGLIYLEESDYPQALTVLREAYGLSTDDDQVTNALATALTANGYYDEALDLRKKSIALRPADPDYRLNLGITALWAHQDKLAAEAFAQALRLDPKLAARIAQARKDILPNRSPGGAPKKVLPRMLDAGRRLETPSDDPTSLPFQPSYQPPAYQPPPAQFQPPSLPYQPPAYQPPPPQVQPPVLPYQPPAYQPPPPQPPQNPPPPPPR